MTTLQRTYSAHTPSTEVRTKSLKFWLLFLLRQHVWLCNTSAFSKQLWNWFGSKFKSTSLLRSQLLPRQILVISWVTEKILQKSENVQRRHVGHILTEISGFGNSQNSNHIGRRDKTAILLKYLQRQKFYLAHVFTSAFSKGKKNSHWS